MYSTPSLFESLAQDDTQQRVASRRALALADTRVANKMGVFLRGAQTEAEFAERLGLVEEDFNWLIESAAQEVGYDSPDKLKKTITASYHDSFAKTACSCGCDSGNCTCGKDCKNCNCHTSANVEFEETPEEEEEQKEASVKSADFLGDNTNPTLPAQGQQGIQPQIAPLQTPFTGPSAQGLEANPAAMSNPEAANPTGAPGQDPNQVEQAMDPSMMAQMQQGINPYVGSWRVVGMNPYDNQWKDDFKKHPEAYSQGINNPGGIPHVRTEQNQQNVYCPTCQYLGPRNSEYPEFCPECASDLGGLNLQSSVTALSPFINAKSLQAMASWLSQASPGNTSSQANPNAILSQVNNLFPDGVRGFLSQNGFMNTSAKEHVSPDEDALLPEEGGASVLDALDHSSSWRVIADGNTDLGGPEPKMDKAHQTGDNPKKDVLGDEDKGRWPTKRKDIVEPIIRENREVEGKPNHELEEIGEKTTEHVDLPAAKPNDTGFYDGGVEKGPHTKTFPKGKQVDPVTHEKQD